MRWPRSGISVDVARNESLAALASVPRIARAMTRRRGREGGMEGVKCKGVEVEQVEMARFKFRSCKAGPQQQPEGVRSRTYATCDWQRMTENHSSRPSPLTSLTHEPDSGLLTRIQHHLPVYQSTGGWQSQ